jgi:hypothetical protein
MSCPDPVVYILTGILPIGAQIHIKALTFFNNVCHQGEKKNTEKKLARRQLTVKVILDFTNEIHRDFLIGLSK